MLAQTCPALTSRIVIEQAKGVLAQSGNLTRDTAFDRLRRHARSRDLLLGDVARQVAFRHRVVSGEQPCSDVLLARS